MATYAITHDLLSGIENAPSGTATFYLPGTLTPITIYGDDTGTPIANPVTLDSVGRAVVYLSQLARMIVKTVGNVTVVDTVINRSGDTTVQVSSTAFNGTDLNTVLGTALTAFGGKDFTYVPSGSVPGMSPKTWMNGVFRNVKAYGAAGDGVTLDNTAISNAVADVSAAGGGIVYFPPGTYLHSATFSLTGKSGVSFVGAGSTVSILKSVGGATLFLTTCSGFFIENLGFTTGSPLAVSQIALSGCTDVRISAVSTAGAQNGIRVFGTNPSNVVIDGRSTISVDGSFGGAATAVQVDPSSAPAQGTAVSVMGSILNGAGAGTGILYDLAASRCDVIGCDFGASAVGVWFANTLAGTGFRSVCNQTPSGVPAFFGAATEPGDLYIDTLDLTGMTQNVTSGGSYTPDRARGSVHRIRGTTTGVAYTVNAPTPTPARDGTRLTLHFFNNAGGAVTGWTLNAVYHVSAAISTVDTNHTMVTFAWDANSSVWREDGRAVTT